MSKKFYTGDWHFFHYNIMKYCNRPFLDLEHMHESIIENVNKIVKKNDLLYVLGDVSFYSEKAYPLVARMNGKKHLLIGNHDAKNISKWDLWESVSHYLEIRDKGYRIVMCHYPFVTWRRSAHGSIHLHGHSHGNLRMSVAGDHHINYGRRIDVGVDCWGFCPITIDEAISGSGV
ncbi:MAG: hydrolase [Candidatus Thorarchaeota archaeon]